MPAPQPMSEALGRRAHCCSCVRLQQSSSGLEFFCARCRRRPAAAQASGRVPAPPLPVPPSGAGAGCEGPRLSLPPAGWGMVLGAGPASPVSGCPVRRARPCGGRPAAAGGWLGSLGAGAPGGQAGRAASSRRPLPPGRGASGAGGPAGAAGRGLEVGPRRWRPGLHGQACPSPGFGARRGSLSPAVSGKLRASLSARKRSAQRAQGHRSKVAGGGVDSDAGSRTPDVRGESGLARVGGRP